MYEMTVERRDWVRHGMTLCREMVEGLEKARRIGGPLWTMYGMQGYRRIRYEWEMRRAAYASLLAGEEIFGEVAVWAAYMVDHADEEHALYRNQISDDEFYTRCAELRRVRDQTLARWGWAA